MLLDMEFAGEILHADVVDVQVVAGSDGANTVKDIFRKLRARQGLNGDVGVGEGCAHGGSDGFYQLLRTLEGYGAGQSHGEISEVAVAGTADANASDFEDTIHM